MGMYSMTRGDFAAGFRAMLPFWLGAAPIAFTYVLSARADGLSSLTIQLMSLFIFSATVQLNTLQLLQFGASSGIVLLTAFLLSVHQILLGISLQRRLSLSLPQKFIAAFLLTDGAYGAAINQRDLRLSYLLGAGLSIFVAWNSFTLLALLLSSFVTIPTNWQFDFAIPLIFMILLIPLLKNRVDVLVAVIAGSMMQLAMMLGVGAASLLLAIIPACLIGAWLNRSPEMSKA